MSTIVFYDRSAFVRVNIIHVNFFFSSLFSQSSSNHSVCMCVVDFELCRSCFLLHFSLYWFVVFSFHFSHIVANTLCMKPIGILSRFFNLCTCVCMFSIYSSKIEVFFSFRFDRCRCCYCHRRRRRWWHISLSASDITS